ncbi:DUF192 domain-containing protein [Marinicella rhabdoformis]|uniref:DUF192 domain-containing protein n=1 Tax=Marinicella rhabdoformis TaxID=2580566 RepID=UPI0012AED3BA|nr:DUF192 domain-containing protein [Marinicella rhabdoformis]
MKNLINLLILTLFISGCQNNNNFVKLNNHEFTVELAESDESRAMGLMYRKEMADDEGMLFIFPNEYPRAFWMKNTLIPLDILYFDKNKKLVSLSMNTPPCKNTTTRCPNYPSVKPAKYVLEINAGLSKKYGFKKGDLLEIHRK